MMRSITTACAAALLLTVAVGISGCGVARGASIASGRDLYGSCDSCHGKSGEGNAALGAPRIAGLPAWYVTNQLERFQQGLRGRHFDDAEGLRMRAMSRQMMSKAEIEAVASHVAAMPRVISTPTLTGTNPAGPQALFPACANCHGPKGEGKQELNAPPLAGLDDWYVARQIRKFQTGVRGTATGDALGPQMAAMSQAVMADQVDSMAAYVHSLAK